MKLINYLKEKFKTKKMRYNEFLLNEYNSGKVLKIYSKENKKGD